MNLITNLPKKWFLIAATVILVVAIPLTMYLVRHQQILRSRATGEGSTISIVPQTQTANLASNQDVSVQVILNPDTPSINALEFTLSYDDKLDNPRFQPGSGLNFDRIPFKTLDTGRRTFHYLGYNLNGTLSAGAGNQTIGTFTFRPASAGESKITITNVRLTVGSASDAVTSIGNPTAAIINIAGPTSPSPTPTPTPAPGQPFISDVSFASDLPACFSSALTTEQLGKVTISWQGQPFSNIFWVDISEDSSFAGTNFFHKQVAAGLGTTTFNTDLTGFNHLITTGAAGRFAPVPGRTYFVRVFNGRANPAGTPETGAGIHSPIRSFSTTLCPTPTPSPSPSPTPVAAACSSVLPEGLTDTGLRVSGGRKVFSAAAVPVTAALQVTRTPVTAIVSAVTSTPKAGQTGASITPNRGIGPQSNDWFLDIQRDVSTTGEKEFTIATSVTNPGGSPVTCPEIIIRIPELIACTYASTRVFVKGPGDDFWVQNRPIVIGQQIRVAAFHNNGQDADPPNFPTDIKITVTEPGGAKHAINNVFDTRTDNDNNILFTPNRPGTWTFSAETKGMRREAGCFEDSASVVVSSLPATTTTVRIAETKGAVEGNDSTLFVEIPYTATPLTVPYSFRNKSLGEHEIWVKFIGTGPAGERTEKTEGPFKITIVSPDPIVSPLSCDLGVDNTVRFTLNGTNFGTAQGRSGSVKTGQTALKIDSWSNSEVRATLEQTATVGQSFPVVLTRNDGVAAESTVCSVAISQIQLGANFFCRQALTQTLSNVTVTVAEGREGGSVAQETVSIGANGLISGLKTKLQQGRGYRIGIKAPGTLRRVVEFTAGKGTTKLALDLPVGDIFPAIGDGKINSADFGQMIREWVVAQAATGERRADLNGDGRVNSFDWACMRPFFNNTDDSEPEAGPLSITVSPTPAGSFTVITPVVSPSATPIPSAAPSPTPSPAAGTPTPTPTPSPSPSPSPSPTP